MNGGANPNPLNVQANQHHAVTVATEAARDWSSVVHQRLGQRPTRLKHSAGNFSCCIFKVPGTLDELNPKAYKPRIVSIGPYHHGAECLKMIEEHKPRFFSALLARTRSFGVDYNHYFNALLSKEEEIRDCYSEPLNFGSSKLIEMMVLDGCFVIEVFRVIANIVEPDPDDPILNMSWSFTSLRRDFFHLENQVPFFVLQILYDLSTPPAEPQCSLVELVLQSSNFAVQKQPKLIADYYGVVNGVVNVKHLLHLIQLTLINPFPEPLVRELADEYLHPVHSVIKLRRAGIKFKPRKCDNLLDIRFHDGVLEIPPLTIDNLTLSFFLNCVAFEQCCCYCLQHITDYVTFIGCLMATEDDMRFLSDHQMLKNYYGTDAEITSFLNNLRKDMGFDTTSSYLNVVIGEVNRYYSNRWRVCVWWTGLKHRYFGTPWSLISAVAASLIVMLTLFQSFFALYPYVRAPRR